MELKPRELEKLTPSEFQLYLQGYQQREEGKMRQKAWMLAHQLSSWTGKRITVDKLLPRPKRDDVRTSASFANREERQAYIKELLERQRRREEED